MNTGVGKKTLTGWEGNAYRVGRKQIHSGKEMHTLTLILYNFEKFFFW